jgi:hypothetical protein
VQGLSETLVHFPVQVSLSQCEGLLDLDAKMEAIYSCAPSSDDRDPSLRSLLEQVTGPKKSGGSMFL